MDGRATATIGIGMRDLPVSDFRIVGDRVWFTLPAAAGRPVMLEGKVTGDVMESTGMPRWRASRSAVDLRKPAESR